MVSSGGGHTVFDMSKYRQGDVFLVKVAAPAEGTEVPTVNGRIVLAEGEVTGHFHTISADADEASLVQTDNGDRFLQVLKEAGVELTHDEHDTILLPPATYRVVQQREYRPRGMSRLVAD